MRRPQTRDARLRRVALDLGCSISIQMISVAITRAPTVFTHGMTRFHRALNYAAEADLVMVYLDYTDSLTVT